MTLAKFTYLGLETGGWYLGEKRKTQLLGLGTLLSRGTLQSGLEGLRPFPASPAYTMVTLHFMNDLSLLHSIWQGHQCFLSFSMS